MAGRCAIIGCDVHIKGQGDGDFVCRGCAPNIPKRLVKLHQRLNVAGETARARKVFERAISAAVERMAGIA